MSGTSRIVALLAAIVLSTPATANAQSTWYVDDNAPADPGPGDPAVSDPEEDGSATHPFDAIQEAIDVALPGDEVRVRDGTYAGQGNRNLALGGKAVTVRAENGPEACVIDCEGAGNGFRLDHGETAASIVDGFTITNGLAQEGGGIFCNVTTPTITRCRIVGNAADESGGGIYSRLGGPTITDCTITRNTAAGIEAYQGGGGVRIRSSNATIRGCTFTENYAMLGGGLFSSYGDSTIADSTFADNRASYGGGIYGTGLNTPLMIVSCTIAENVATGGAGGIYTGGNRPTIIGCMIAGNAAAGYAGGVFCDGNTATIASCTIIANSAENGGAVFCGGASCAPVLRNCTITQNTATQHGGGICGDFFSHASISDCIFWGDSAPAGSEASLRSGASLTVTYSDVEGDWTGVSAEPDCTLDWGEGNLAVEPLFLDPDGPDDDPETWEDNDLHLTGDSPCIDVGDPDLAPDPDDLDVDRQWRVWDGDGDGSWRADMGSDEFASRCFGDLDGDGAIELADLAALLANYGSGAGMTPADGDLDVDGDVDLADLATLLALYGTDCG